MTKPFPPFLRAGVWLAMFLSALLLAPGLAAAATFTNTPSVVSNTYSGIITLQIGGLTNGETVVVQKFLDANTNGTINAGDWLVQQFTLTDGQASVIGGVTNVNVPGDSTGTNGAITTQLSFLTSGLEQQFVGKYLYKLSSPTGRFAPITNLFTVTNYGYAQSFTGSVRASGTNVPNAGVLAFVPSTGGGLGRPVTGVFANNSGTYTLKVPPGTYLLFAFKSNYVADVSVPTVVTLGPGATLTTNLSLLPATRTISGKAVDAANSSIGLPGLLVAWQSTNSLLAVGFTDTNGNFTVPVTSSQWQAGGDSSGLDLHGYLDLQDQNRPQVLTTTGSVAGVTFAFPKGTALFYGTVKDEQNRPLAGISLSGNINNGSGPYRGDATTDQNGYYVMAVNAGFWSASIDSGNNPDFANYIFSETPGGTNISDGQAVELDFLALTATNQLSGYVKDNNSNPISNVWVWAQATISNLTYQSGAATDPTGHYAFNVANGNWSVGVSCGGGNSSLGTNYLCPGNQSVVISNNNATVNFTVLAAPYQITGYVKDNANSPVTNVGVYAYATLNGTNFSEYQDTDGNGYFALAAANGSWHVGLNCGGGASDSLTARGYQCVSEQTVNISNGNGTADFTVQPCPALQVTTTSPLPGGQVGSFYNIQLQGAGCWQPFSWSLSPSSPAPPPGLDLATDGVLSGSPTASGSFSFTVRLTDSASHTIDQLLSLTISPAPMPLQVTTTSLPGATQDVFYSTSLMASGGRPPYAWSLAPASPSPPANLVLATNGVLSGTPVISGSFFFTVRVTDALLATANQILALTVSPSTNSPGLVLGAPARSGSGQFQFTFDTVAGVNYTIQYSTTLNTWSSVLSFTSPGGPITIQDPNATGGQRFYRVKIGP